MLQGRQELPQILALQDLQEQLVPLVLQVLPALLLILGQLDIVVQQDIQVGRVLLAQLPIQVPRGTQGQLGARVRLGLQGRLDAQAPLVSPAPLVLAGLLQIREQLAQRAQLAQQERLEMLQILVPQGIQGRQDEQVLLDLRDQQDLLVEMVAQVLLALPVQLPILAQQV